jgi:hypothetical protein
MMSSPEVFAYELVAKIVVGGKGFPWSKERTPNLEELAIDGSYDLNGETEVEELGLSYAPFHKWVTAPVQQASTVEEQRNQAYRLPNQVIQWQIILCTVYLGGLRTCCFVLDSVTVLVTAHLVR